MKPLKWLLLGLLLAAFVALMTTGAAAQAPVTLTAYDPTSTVQVTKTFAPRLSDLNGKTICELWNGLWEGPRTFSVITAILQKQFPTAKVVDYTQFPTLNIYAGVNAELQAVQVAKATQAAGCQAVIVGNAG